MSNVALSIVCFIIECVVLLFVILSLGLDVLRGKKDTIIMIGGKVRRSCYSVWGQKACGPHKTNPNSAPYKGFPTRKIEKIANAAAAFDVVSLVVVLVAVILSALVMCKCMSALVAVILYIIAVITIIIAIGCLLGAYYIHAAPLVRVKDLYTLGDATGLIVTGWCLQVINLILMIVNECCL